MIHVPESHCSDEFALTDEYARHLRDVRSKLAAPEEFILEALKDVTVGAIVSKRRIIAGEANEVYDIRTSDERDLIVRISRDREKDFEQECWAIGQCMKIDVPVPTILVIKHFSEGANPIDICIQDKLAGDLLSIAAASLPRDGVRSICVRVGELLARIHGIRTKGHGYLNRQGRRPISIYLGHARARRATIFGIGKADRIRRDRNVRHSHHAVRVMESTTR